jgi:chromosome segregation ATPase
MSPQPQRLKGTSVKKPTLPHIRTHSEYAAAIAKQAEISGALAKVTARIDEIEALQRQTQPNVDAIEAADALLRGDALIGLREELQELQAQARILRAAQESQQQAVTTAASQASSAIRQQLQGQHSEIAERALDALLMLEAAQKDEADLFDAVHAAGYRVTFAESVACPAIGRMSEPSDLLWRRASELSRYVGARAPAGT